MKVFRSDIFGVQVEARLGDFGSEVVLVNGREVSRYRLGWLHGKTHHFDVTTPDGKNRHIEVRLVNGDRLGLKKVARIAVDGVDLAVLHQEPFYADPARCRNCGYSLKELMPVNGEVCCPECGRHWSAPRNWLGKEPRG